MRRTSPSARQTTAVGGSRNRDKSIARVTRFQNRPGFLRWQATATPPLVVDVNGAEHTWGESGFHETK